MIKTQRSAADAEMCDMRAVGRDTGGRIRRVPNAISGTSGSRRRTVTFDSPNAISY